MLYKFHKLYRTTAEKFYSCLWSYLFGIFATIRAQTIYRYYKLVATNSHATVPSIAQLVERWTVVVTQLVIHRSLVRIRLEGRLNIFQIVPQLGIETALKICECSKNFINYIVPQRKYFTVVFGPIYLAFIQQFVRNQI